MGPVPPRRHCPLVNLARRHGVRAPPEASIPPTSLQDHSYGSTSTDPPASSAKASTASPADMNDLIGDAKYRSGHDECAANTGGAAN